MIRAVEDGRANASANRWSAASGADTSEPHFRPLVIIAAWLGFQEELPPEWQEVSGERLAAALFASQRLNGSGDDTGDRTLHRRIFAVGTGSPEVGPAEAEP